MPNDHYSLAANATLRLQELENRLKVLEVFHHWATTQVLPRLQDDVEKLQEGASTTDEVLRRLNTGITTLADRIALLEGRLTTLEKVFLEALPKLLSNHQIPPL